MKRLIQSYLFSISVHTALFLGLTQSSHSLLHATQGEVILQMAWTAKSFRPVSTHFHSREKQSPTRHQAVRNTAVSMSAILTLRHDTTLLPREAPSEASQAIEAQKPPIPGEKAGSVDSSYLALIRTKILSRLKYPPESLSKGEKGTVRVRVVLEPTGQIQEEKLIQSSGVERLDHAALELIQSTAPFPYPRILEGSTPDRLSFEIPIHYGIR